MGRVLNNGAVYSSKTGGVVYAALVYIGQRPKSFYLAFRDLGRMVRAWEEAD